MVWTDSRLLRSNSSAMAVMRNAPRTPANCESEPADVSMLHWSELHD